MRRAGVVLVSLVGALLLASTASGGTSLAPCGEEAPGALCGFVDVPLDRKAPAAGTIPIAFELHARRDQSAPSLGTVILVEGGPGGASTELRFFYDMLGPLFDRRDLLARRCPGNREVPSDRLSGRAGRVLSDAGDGLSLRCLAG